MCMDKKSIQYISFKIIFYLVDLIIYNLQGMVNYHNTIMVVNKTMQA